MKALAPCPSIPHRAVMGLVSAALSGEVPEGLEQTLAAASDEDLARIASAQHVHTMMGPPLARHPALAGAVPRDLCLFFEAMHEANGARLAEGRAQLAQIGAAFAEAGLRAVALKGGGDMLDPLHSDPALRFVSDLDLLVPAERAAEARACLAGLGGTWADYTDYTASLMHHLPPIEHPDWTFPVEVHLRVYSASIEGLLPAAAVMERAEVTEGTPRGIAVMAGVDRACHLLAHAWLPLGHVSLRAGADWIALRRRVDRAEVAERMAAVGLGRAFTGIDALADRIERPGDTPDLSREGDAWARVALRSLGHPGRRRARMRLHWAMGYVTRFAGSRAYRAHLLRRAASAEGWRAAWDDYRTRVRRIR